MHSDTTREGSRTASVVDRKVLINAAKPVGSLVMYVRVLLARPRLGAWGTTILFLLKMAPMALAQALALAENSSVGARRKLKLWLHQAEAPAKKRKCRRIGSYIHMPSL